jgi:hypothetical protein
VLSLFRDYPGFQVLGHFAQLETPEELMWQALEEITLKIPEAERSKWPDPDYHYTETCPICGFGYYPRLPLDVAKHAKEHAQYLARE